MWHTICRIRHVLTLESAPVPGPSGSTGLPAGCAPSRSYCWSIEFLSLINISVSAWSALCGDCGKPPPEWGAAFVRSLFDKLLERNMADVAELCGDLRGDGAGEVLIFEITVAVNYCRDRKGAQHVRRWPLWRMAGHCKPRMRWKF